MTHLLLDAPLSEEALEYAHTIHSSGTTLLSILNDILDFSKIEADQLELESAPFSPRSCVSEAAAVIQSRCAEKGLDLAIELEDSIPQIVVGDVTRLRQVLVNLLGNASKFTETGGITLTASAETEGDGSCRLHFAVTDTGIGIPADRLDRLFELFTQVDASTTRKHGGTGLGLAISQRLTEAMGGTLRVESDAGAGSTFRFDVRVDVPKVRTPDRPPRSRASITRSETSLNLLVAEDNHINQRLIRLMLERQGHTVTIAGNGREAVEKATAQHYDAILMDVRMPIMDGVEATLALNRALGPRRPYVIACTGDVTTSTRQACEQARFNDFLAKPLQPEVLTAALDRASRHVQAEAARGVESALGRTA